MKPPKDNIEALMLIKDVKKNTCMGGFIEDISKIAIAEIFSLRFKSPLEMVVKALEYRGITDTRELLLRTEEMYKAASFDNSWFKSNVKYSTSPTYRREFTRWFIETSLHLCANAMLDDNFLDLTEFFDEIDKSCQLKEIINDMTWIECKVLSYRYSEEGEHFMDAKAIAELPNFNCKKEFIEGIIRYYDSKINVLNKRDKSILYNITHSGACVKKSFVNNNEYDPMIDAYETAEPSLVELLSEEELIELSDYLKE